ncbi:MAG: DUF192 domain-containing protein, partial [Bacteroidota bacterium]
VYSNLVYTPGSVNNNPPSVGYIPPFQKEGELSFFDQESRELLKKIDIEIADDEATITQGLMYRREMPDSQGMLFIFDQMEPRSFWMKNTYISLDIIYVDQFNQIVSIAKSTTPKSTRSIPSGKPAQYVIEVIAGFCDSFSVKEGDFVEF